jgi:tetratricopeptide (TPR) repeat protein
MHMTSRLLASGAAFGLLLAMQPASANDYRPLMKAMKFAEAERMASAKLTQDPANANAMVARTDAILAGGGEARIDEAVKQAEKCVATQPATAACHLSLGKALGAKAMQGGMMAAMTYAGTIRDSFKKAVELDPRSVEARFGLLQFYMMAPSIAGGGTGKAETLAAQTVAINPEAAKLMQAKLDLGADKFAKAEAAALAIQPGTDLDLLDEQEGVLVSLGIKYIAEKKLADSERVFRDAQKRFPDSDNALYGIARTQQEQGKHREALAGFEQVLAKLAKPHVHYRIAQSQLALGDKAKASAAFEKALAFKSGLSKKMRSDAEDQLKALKG